MLIDKTQSTTERRQQGRERRLWDRPNNRHTPLGCPSCPEFSVCGALRTDQRMFDCTSLCCGSPDSCTKVCRLNREFVRRVREVNGFELGNTPSASLLSSPELPPVIPLIYHVSRLDAQIRLPFVGLQLYRMCGRDGIPKYHSRQALREAFKLSDDTDVVLTGTAQDQPLERWWGLQTAGRLAVIRSIRESGVALVTTPNFSLAASAPRWNDLHAMKRIAITYHEFASEGVPAALHVNARTANDYLRWTEHIQRHTEITHIAFEFTTGSRHVERRSQHVEWLNELGRNAGRRLNLLLRGGMEVEPELRDSYARISTFATNAFMKCTRRQRAMRKPDGKLSWISAPTPQAAPLDELLAHNIAHEIEAMNEAANRSGS
jgi:hypothetical protein